MIVYDPYTCLEIIEKIEQIFAREQVVYIKMYIGIDIYWLQTHSFLHVTRLRADEVLYTMAWQEMCWSWFDRLAGSKCFF